MKYHNSLLQISYLVLTLLACDAMAVTAGDKYETDDTQTQAKGIWCIDTHDRFTVPDSAIAIAVKEHLPQTHTIHNAQDEDWLVFWATGNEWHEIQAWPPENSTLDLRLELYNATGQLLEEKDFNFAGEQEIMDYFLGGESQKLWLRITAMEYEDTGQAQEYKIFVWFPNLSPSSAITGFVNDANTGAGVSLATVTSGDASTLTATNGAYIMPHVAGSFDFTATAPDGISSETKTAQLVSDGITEVNFTITGSTTSCGDVNGDNNIDIRDAYDIARYIVGLPALTEFNASVADVTQDEVIDIRDALTIARKLVDLPTPNSCL